MPGSSHKAQIELEFKSNIKDFISATESQLKKLQSVVQTLKGQIDGLVKSFKDLNWKDIASLAGNVVKMASALRKINAGMKGIDTTAKTASVAIVKIASKELALQRIAPALEKMADAFQKMSDKLNDLNPKIDKFIGAITMINQQLVGTLKDAGKTMGGLASATLKSASYMNRLKNEADGAGKKAKEVAKATKWFQDLNSTAITTTKSMFNLKNVLYAIGAFTMYRFGKQFLESASDAKEAQNIFDVVYKDNIDGARAMQSQMQETFGLSTKLYAQNVANLGAMMVQLGVESETAMKSANRAFMSATDISSAYNMNFESALEKVRAGIAGVSKPLQVIGVDVSVEAMKKFSEAMGLAWDELDRGAQSLLRAHKIQSDLGKSGVTGDFLRTSDSYANSLRQVQQLWEEIKVILGQAIMQEMERLLKYIKNNKQELLNIASTLGGMIKDVTEAVAKIGDFLTKHTGIIKALAVIFAGNKVAKIMLDFSGLVAGIQSALTAGGWGALAMKGGIYGIAMMIGYGVIKMIQDWFNENKVNGQEEEYKKKYAQEWKYLKDVEYSHLDSNPELQNKEITRRLVKLENQSKSFKGDKLWMNKHVPGLRGVEQDEFYKLELKAKEYNMRLQGMLDQQSSDTSKIYEEYQKTEEELKRELLEMSAKQKKLAFKGVLDSFTEDLGEGGEWKKFSEMNDKVSQEAKYITANGVDFIQNRIDTLNDFIKKMLEAGGEEAMDLGVVKEIIKQRNELEERKKLLEDGRKRDEDNQKATDDSFEQISKDLEAEIKRLDGLRKEQIKILEDIHKDRVETAGVDLDVRVAESTGDVEKILDSYKSKIEGALSKLRNLILEDGIVTDAEYNSYMNVITAKENLMATQEKYVAQQKKMEEQNKKLEDAQKKRLSVMEQLRKAEDSAKMKMMSDVMLEWKMEQARMRGDKTEYTNLKIEKNNREIASLEDVVQRKLLGMIEGNPELAKLSKYYTDKERASIIEQNYKPQTGSAPSVELFVPKELFNTFNPMFVDIGSIKADVENIAREVNLNQESIKQEEVNRLEAQIRDSKNYSDYKEKGDIETNADYDKLYLKLFGSKPIENLNTYETRKFGINELDNVTFNVTDTGVLSGYLDIVTANMRDSILDRKPSLAGTIYDKDYELNYDKIGTLDEKYNEIKTFEVLEEDMRAKVNLITENAVTGINDSVTAFESYMIKLLDIKPLSLNIMDEKYINVQKNLKQQKEQHEDEMFEGVSNFLEKIKEEPEEGVKREGMLEYLKNIITPKVYAQNTANDAGGIAFADEIKYMLEDRKKEVADSIRAQVIAEAERSLTGGNYLSTSKEVEEIGEVGKIFKDMWKKWKDNIEASMKAGTLNISNLPYNEPKNVNIAENLIQSQSPNIEDSKTVHSTLDSKVSILQDEIDSMKKVMDLANEVRKQEKVKPIIQEEENKPKENVMYEIAREYTLRMTGAVEEMLLQAGVEGINKITASVGTVVSDINNIVAPTLEQDVISDGITAQLIVMANKVNQIEVPDMKLENVYGDLESDVGKIRRYAGFVNETDIPGVDIDKLYGTVTADIKKVQDNKRLLAEEIDNMATVIASASSMPIPISSSDRNDGTKQIVDVKSTPKVIEKAVDTSMKVLKGGTNILNDTIDDFNVAYNKLDEVANLPKKPISKLADRVINMVDEATPNMLLKPVQSKGESLKVDPNVKPMGSPSTAEYSFNYNSETGDIESTIGTSLKSQERLKLTYFDATDAIIKNVIAMDKKNGVTAQEGDEINKRIVQNEEMKKTIEDTRTALEKFLDSLSNIGSVVSMMGDMFNSSFLGNVGGYINGVSSDISGMWNIAKQSIKPVAGTKSEQSIEGQTTVNDMKADELTRKISDSMDGFLTGLKQMDWGEFFEGDFAQGLATTLGATIGQLFGASGTSGAIGSGLGGMLGGALGGSDAVKGLFESVGGSMLGSIAPVVGNIVGSALGGAVGGLFKSYKEDNEKRRKEAEAKMQENTNAVSDLTKVIETFSQAITSMTDTLVTNLAKIPTVSAIQTGNTVYENLEKALRSKELDNLSVQAEYKKKKWYGSVKRDYKVFDFSTEELMKWMGMDNLLAGGKEFTDLSVSQMKQFQNALGSIQNSDQFKSLLTANGIKAPHQINDSNLAEYKKMIDEYIKAMEKLGDKSNLEQEVWLSSFAGIAYQDAKKLREEYIKLYEEFGLNANDYMDEINAMVDANKVLITITQDVRSSFIDAFKSGSNAGDAFVSSLSVVFDALKTNIASVIYGTKFDALNTQLESMFKEMTDYMADGRIPDLTKYTSRIASMIKQAEKIDTEMMDFFKKLKDELLRQGIAESVIDDILGLNKVDELTQAIRDSLKSGIKEGLEKGDITLASKSIGDAIREHVTDALIDSFVNAYITQGMFDAYLKDIDFTGMSFEEAFNKIQDTINKLDQELNVGGIGQATTNKNQSTDLTSKVESETAGATITNYYNQYVMDISGYTSTQTIEQLMNLMEEKGFVKVDKDRI